MSTKSDCSDLLAARFPIIHGYEQSLPPECFKSGQSGSKLEALGQGITPPRHVLLVSRYGYRDPDHNQNLTACSLAHCQPSPKISRKSVRKFLRKVANRQTDRQIDKLETVSIAEPLQKTGSMRP